MSYSKDSEAYREHTYWHKDGDVLAFGPYFNTVYAGVITATSADDTDFGENLNDDSLIEAVSSTKRVIIKPENGTVALLFRLRVNGTENDSNVLQILAASGVDYYTKTAQLTTTAGGQLDSNGYFFIDTIEEANNDWITDTAIIQPSTPDDDIAMYVLNTHGFDRFAFFATTRNSTGLYIDWKKA